MGYPVYWKAKCSFWEGMQEWKLLATCKTEEGRRKAMAALTVAQRTHFLYSTDPELDTGVPEDLQEAIEVRAVNHAPRKKSPTTKKRKKGKPSVYDYSVTGDKKNKPTGKGGPDHKSVEDFVKKQKGG